MSELTFELLFVLVTVIGNLFLALVVFLDNPKSKINQRFLIMVVMAAIWITAGALSNVQNNFSVMKMFMMIDFFFAPLLAYTFLVFTVTVWSDLAPRVVSRNRMSVLFLITLLSSIISVKTDWIVKSVIETEHGIGYISGKLDWLYSLFILSLTLSGLGILYRKYDRSEGMSRKQLRLILIGSAIPAGSTSVLILVALRILNPLYPDNKFFTVILPGVARSSFIFLTAMCSFAILRYRLFGIRVVISKFFFWLGAAAMLFVPFYVVIYLEQEIFVSLLKPSVVLLNIVIAFLTAFGFSLYEKSLRRVVNRYISKYSIDPEEALEIFTTRFAVVDGPELVIQNLMRYVTELYSTNKQILILVNEKKDDAVISESCGLSKEEHELLMDEETMNTILNSSLIAITKRSQLIRNTSLKTILKALGIEIALPVRVNDWEGVYLLGARSKGEYSDEDIQVIKEVLELSVMKI